MTTDVNRRVLPGFGLSLGYTMVYMSLLVLIPLTACFIKASSLGLGEFIDAVWTERARLLGVLKRDQVVSSHPGGEFVPFDADPIEAADLPPEARVSASEISEKGARLATLSEFKEFSERQFLVAKLRENGWNISRTAEVIETPRSNLYKKIEHHHISRESDG